MSFREIGSYAVVVGMAAASLVLLKTGEIQHGTAQGFLVGLGLGFLIGWYWKR